MSLDIEFAWTLDVKAMADHGEGVLALGGTIQGLRILGFWWIGRSRGSIGQDVRFNMEAIVDAL